MLLAPKSITAMLRSSPRLADSWGARLAAHGYEPGLRPVSTKSAITHSMVMRSKTGTVRIIEAHHNWSIKRPKDA